MGILEERAKSVSVAKPVKPPLLVEALAVPLCSTDTGSAGPGELAVSA